MKVVYGERPAPPSKIRIVEHAPLEPCAPGECTHVEYVNEDRTISKWSCSKCGQPREGG